MHNLGLVLLPEHLKERRTNNSHGNHWVLAGSGHRRTERGFRATAAQGQEPGAWGAPSAMAQLCDLSVSPAVAGVPDQRPRLPDSRLRHLICPGSPSTLVCTPSFCRTVSHSDRPAGQDESFVSGP